MTVPFLDLGRLHASIDGELQRAIARVIDGSSFIGGKEVASFEEAFADMHGARGAVGCASGTDAIALALRAFGVGPGDEVIVPSMTFIATAEAVVHVGARPVVVDVEPDSLLISAAAVDAAITERTRAVVPVHLYGHLVPFDLLSRWRDRGLLVIEDAAQAHLGTFAGRPVGSAGHAACFSFYPGKNLGAMGDAGAVISQDLSVIDEIRRLANHGRTSKYRHDVLGWSSRLDGLQAAILGAKLPHLAEWTQRRRAAAARYRELLGCGQLVPWTEGAVHHLLVARVTGREAVQVRLKQAGIGSGVHYPIALSQQPWIRYSGAKPAPNAELAADEVLSLPMDPLMSDSDVDTVCEAFARALEQ